MATNVSERVYKISVDGASAIKQLEKIAGSATSIDQRFAKLGTALKAAFAVGTVVVGIKSFTDAIGSAIDQMDEMYKASQKIGISVEELSGLKFVADQSGVAFESLQNGLKKLNQSLFDFDTATDAGAQSLKKFGVLVGDDTATALGKIADGFAEIPDGVQKTSLAMAIFGKAGADLIPLLNGGSKSIEELTARAKELGIVFDGAAAKQAEIFNDKISEMKLALNGVFIQISQGLLPVLSAMTEKLSESVKVGDVWKTVGEGIGEAILGIAESTILATRALIGFGKTLADIATIAASIPTIGTGKGAKKAEAANAATESLKRLFGDPEDVKKFGQDWLDAITDIRVRLDPLSQDPLGTLGLKGNRGGAGGAGGGGKAEKSDLEKWLEGLKKSADELDLIPEKMNILAQAMNRLKESGEEGSSAFKVMSDAYKKLNEETAKGNVGAEIELQVQKIKEEATLTAEKMTYLGQAIATAFEQGDTEGAQILIDMMDKLKGKTDETADQFKKLGDGIEQAIANNANNAVNSFIDNIGKAEFSFTDFATSVIKDIAKIVVQLLIMKPIIDSIKGYFGGMGGGVADFAFANGGSFSGGTSLAQGVYTQPTLFKFAKGGTFGRNTGLMGEAGPEAIIPLKRTASGQLGVQGSPVNVNVYNNAGVEVKTEATTSSDGTKQIDVYIERKVKDGIANGSFDRAFKGAYGLSRMGA